MIVEELKKSIIDYAIHGKLSYQSSNDSLVNNIIPPPESYSGNSKFNLKIDNNDIPFEIPDNWSWVKIGMLFNYQNGYAYKPSETLKNGIGYPIIKSQNIMKRIVELNSQTSYVENPNERMLKSKIIKGDFLMCLSSQSNNPEPLGKTAIYNFDSFALLNQRVLKLTPINYNLSEYLYYVMNSFYFHDTVSHKGGGSAQSNLKLEHVMEMYVPIPPLEEQQRIISKIKLIFDKLNEIEPIVQKLSTIKMNFSTDLKNSIINSAISGKLLSNDPELLPAINSSLNESDIPFEIPDNWSWVTIKEVLDIQTGLGYKKTDQCSKKEGTIRVLRGGNINNNYQYELKDDDVYVKNIDKYTKLQIGDILTPSVTSMEQMGKVAYIDKELPGITAGGFVYIMRSLNKEILLPKYAVYFISSKFHKDMCKLNINKSGQAFYNLRKSGLIDRKSVV